MPAMRRAVALAIAPGFVAAVNPITKVIGMLENLKKEVEAEQETAKSSYTKFACWCKNGKDETSANIAGADAEAAEQSEEEKQQQAAFKAAVAALEQARADRKEYKAELKKKTAERTAENTKFSEANQEMLTNLRALALAMEAISQATGGNYKAPTTVSPSFMQKKSKSDVLATVSSIIEQYSGEVSMDNDQKEQLASFLQNPSNSYSSNSGEIMGILQQLYETMMGNKKEEVAEEEAAAAAFEEARKLLTEQISTASQKIENKLKEKGNTQSAKVAAMHQKLAAEKEAQDMKDQLATMAEDCATMGQKYDEAKATRTMELAAIQDTINYLNTDEVREKMMDATIANKDAFLQTAQTKGSKSVRAVAALSAVKSKNSALAFLLKSLRTSSKAPSKGDFTKICKLIVDMQAQLKQDQINDQDHKDECTEKKNKYAFDMAQSNNAIAGHEKDITAHNAKIADLTGKIAEKEAALASQRQELEQATTLRKEEKEEFNTNFANNNIAIKILKGAANRMNKFYNPDKYTTAATKQVSEADRMEWEAAKRAGDEKRIAELTAKYAGDSALSEGNAMQGALLQKLDPAPTVDLGSSKKTGGNNIVSMIEMIIQDLEKDNMQMETAEAAAVKAFGILSDEAKATIAELENAIAESNKNKKATESALSDSTGNLEAEQATLGDLTEGNNLNANECSFLWNHFDERKTAREEERKGLQLAHGILCPQVKEVIEEKELSAAEQIAGSTKQSVPVPSGVV